MTIRICRIDDPTWEKPNREPLEEPMAFPREDRQCGPIFTLGYQGRTLDEFVKILKGNKIVRVIDVRFSTASRFKPDFSSATLARELPRAGILYAHRKEFGVPHEWQKPYKEGVISFECLDKYYRWRVATTTDFRGFVNDVKEGGRTALLCYERHATPTRDQKIACHRSILSAMMQEVGGFGEPTHL